MLEKGNQRNRSHQNPQKSPFLRQTGTNRSQHIVQIGSGAEIDLWGRIVVVVLLVLVVFFLFITHYSLLITHY